MNQRSIWDLNLDLIAHSFHPARDSFTYAVETYEQWAWLALENGHFRFRLGKTTPEAHCHGGDWVLCAPGEPLARELLRSSSYHFARFEVSNGDDNALRALQGLGTLRDGQRARANFCALREAPFGEAGKLWKAHLLLDFLRCAWQEKAGFSQNAPRDAQMEQVRAILERDFARKISLQDLARRSRLSAPAFSRRFKGALGVSPQELLLQTRLDYARQLLLQSDETLEFIAQKCGFANGFYLSRQWTKRYGIAPARFRRLHRV